MKKFCKIIPVLLAVDAILAILLARKIVEQKKEIEKYKIVLYEKDCVIERALEDLQVEVKNI